MATSSFSSRGGNIQVPQLTTPESNHSHVVPNVPATPFSEKVSHSGTPVPNPPAKVFRSGRHKISKTFA